MEKTGLKPIDELIINAKKGDGYAFTALWDTHVCQLKKYIKSRMKNADDYVVDDICSRSFEKAFRQIQNYDPKKSQFLTWLCTIAKNTSLDFLEQESRTHPKDRMVYIDDNKPSGVEEIADHTEDALNSIIKSETQEEQEKYIERLPELYREVARKRLIDGLKYNEIAESLDLQLNTVKTRIRRAKSMIDQLRKEDDENEA